jgi:hypothetical protein
MRRERKPDPNLRDAETKGTGSHAPDEEAISVVYPFDRYMITVKLTPDGRFLGIEEVAISKDFLDYAQKVAALSSTGYHDVEQYYKDLETESDSESQPK